MHPHLDLFGIQVSTYFLVISLASTLSSLWFIRRAERAGLRRVVAIDLTLVILACGFVGARLLHVFYEDPGFYIESPLAVLKIWNGGFVYLGGVIGAWIGAVLFCVWQREPFWFWADLAAAPIGLGYALGRVACFLNGCCYGRYCELAWAVNGRHPTQLYATLWELTVVAVLLVIERRGRLVSGIAFNLWLFLHALGRMVMEIFRDDDRGPLMAGLSLGTWISLVLGLYASYNLVSTLQIRSSK